MADVLDLPAKVVSLLDEAKECLKLAQAEPQGGELRIILAGMAMGWLKLADYTQSSQALEFEHWPAPGSEDTELGVFMGPEVSHGATKIYAGVQA
jgi:hypothetical protein